MQQGRHPGDHGFVPSPTNQGGRLDVRHAVLALGAMGARSSDETGCAQSQRMVAPMLRSASPSVRLVCVAVVLC